MISGKPKGSQTARLQRATVAAIAVTILAIGWVMADESDEIPSATFYEPLRVPLVNVDVMVGTGDEDQSK